MSQPQGHIAAGRVTSMKKIPMTKRGSNPGLFRLVAAPGASQIKAVLFFVMTTEMQFVACLTIMMQLHEFCWRSGRTTQGHWIYRVINPLTLELDIYSLAHHLCKMWIFYEHKMYKIRKYTTFCGGINEDGERNSTKLIKYICWLNI